MNIEVVRATADQQEVLGNLAELYQHDFTEFDGNDVGEEGRFGFDRLPDYFRESERHPFLDEGGRQVRRLRARPRGQSLR